MQDCAAKGVKGRLGTVLRAYLNRYLPQDAHTLCHGNTYLAVTKGESDVLLSGVGGLVFFVVCVSQQTLWDVAKKGMGKLCGV